MGDMDLDVVVEIDDNGAVDDNISVKVKVAVQVVEAEIKSNSIKITFFGINSIFNAASPSL